MIKVVAKSKIQAGKLDRAIELYSGMLEATRNEEGCISYDLCKDTKEDDTIAMIEEWRNKDCFNAHLETDHYKETVPHLLEITEHKDVSIFDKIK